MRLSHKLGKMANPALLRSAKRHAGRLLAPRRRGTSRLDAEEIIRSIDEDQIRDIQRRHGVDEVRHGPRKYLDLERWIAINIRRVEELELDWGRRQSVLDVGSGAGYFLYICKWLGHRTLGLDIGNGRVFGEVFHALGLERLVWRVEAWQPLTDLGRKFDLITAFMICFNGHKGPKLWKRTEWAFFLDDLETRLRPGGRIRLGFNREKDGKFFTDDLREYFLSRGAEIDVHRVTFRPGPSRPA